MDRSYRRIGNGRQQNLPAARARTSLASVLGLGRQESLTPHARDVHSVRRNEATFGKFMVHQAAAFE
jgi:hypothetical protein